MRSLTDNLAEEALDLVEERFASQTDPYGKRWPKKVFPDGRSVLVGKTTHLRRGWKQTRSDGKGFRISPSVTYAKYTKGTGLWGPSRKRIVPKTKKALAFSAVIGKTKGGKWKSKKLFMRSVKGSPPRLMTPLKGKLPATWAGRFADTCADWFRENFDK